MAGGEGGPFLRNMAFRWLLKEALLSFRDKITQYGVDTYLKGRGRGATPPVYAPDRVTLTVLILFSRLSLR